MYRRHTLLDITRAGRERILAEAVRAGFPRGLWEPMLLPETPPLPGIVRRDESGDGRGMIPVGFSSWIRIDSGRARLPGFVRPEEVTGSRSPFDIVTASPADVGRVDRTPALRALRRLADAFAAESARFGVWGSAAMELAMGKPYTHDGSDLDILLEPSAATEARALRGWLAIARDAEREFGIRVDAEVALNNGYGVSLKELLGEGRTVLGKGSLDVRLFDKNDILCGFSTSEH